MKAVKNGKTRKVAKLAPAAAVAKQRGVSVRTIQRWRAAHDPRGMSVEAEAAAVCDQVDAYLANRFLVRK